MIDIGVLPPSSINNNVALIMRGCRICEKAADMPAKALFSKFCVSAGWEG